MGFTGVGSIGLGAFSFVFRGDPSHHRFLGFLGDCERLGFRLWCGGLHLGGESGLGLVHGIAGVEALDPMAVFVSGLADAQMLRVWLDVGQTWAGSRELRDIAIEELHL